MIYKKIRQYSFIQLFGRCMAVFLFAVALCGAAVLSAREEHADKAALQNVDEEIAEIGKMDIRPRTFMTAEKISARTAVELILNNHYSGKRMTPQLSSQWFSEYFVTLDPYKLFFTQADIDTFIKYENNLYSPTNGVNLAFASEVYCLMLKRMQEWVQFGAKTVDSDFDFSRNETYLWPNDIREIKWCDSMKQLKERWRLRAKNHMLSAKLNEERQAEKRQEKGKGKLSGRKEDSKSGDAGKTEKKTHRRKSPQERYKRQLCSSFKLRNQAENMQILESFLNAFAGLMDPHTSYMAPVTKENFDIDMGLSLEGIGATLVVRDNYVTVYSLVPGSPAARSGKIHIGDRITAVAQSPDEEPMDAVGMPLNKVVRKIRGPKGSTVYLTILPEGATNEQVISLVRDEIAIKEAEAQSRVIEKTDANGQRKRILDLYLPSFYADFRQIESQSDYKSATRDVAAIIAAAQKDGALDGVVLDMRDNGGGSLEEAVSMAGLFMGNYPVVQVRQADTPGVVRFSRQEPIYRGPLVVLVNHFSASATEIVAAALQDSGRALIMGDTMTHGKGTVQSLLDLAETRMFNRFRSFFFKDAVPGAVKLTIAKFYRINGGSTQERGVVPDITFASFADYMDTCEAKIPNALPWDEIQPAQYMPFTNLEKQKPELLKLAARLQQENADYRQMLQAIEQYRLFREVSEVPLEINARRDYNARERSLAKLMRKFRPSQRFRQEEQKTLEDEDEDEDDPENSDEEEKEDGSSKKNDIVLDVAMDVLMRMNPNP